VPLHKRAIAPKPLHKVFLTAAEARSVVIVTMTPTKTTAKLATKIKVVVKVVSAEGGPGASVEVMGLVVVVGFPGLQSQAMQSSESSIPQLQLLRKHGLQSNEKT
jgi:hypothetical protein